MARQKNNTTQATRIEKTKSVSGSVETKPTIEKGKPLPKVWIYGLGFLLLYIFCTLIYGDVFSRAAHENFVSTDATQMKFVLDQTWGNLYWIGRFLLLVYKNLWLGGLCLATVLTLTAFLLDRAFACRRNWTGIGFIIPLAELAYLVYLGTSLYHIGEPARLTVIPVCALLVSCVIATVAWLLRKPKAEDEDAKKLPSPIGAVAAASVYALLIAGSYFFCHNEMLHARMKNNVDAENWDAVIADGLSTRHPDRTVGAYYAIALLQKDQLIERLFEFSFNYKDTRLTEKHQNESTLYTADANFYAGLTNMAYENCMNLTMLSGPRLHLLKRMAQCAILNGEAQLARKYLRIISEMPFEQDFVEKHSRLVDKDSLIMAEPVLARIVSLRPREVKFEQQFRQPAFLGYNVGLLSGSDPTLITSTAACLYSKNLPLTLTRAEILQQKQILPLIVQQAVAIASITDKSVKQRFPNISNFVYSEVSRFANQAVPLLGNKEKMREELEEKWRGTYLYYYYCMNAPKTKDAHKAEDKGGVN